MDLVFRFKLLLLDGWKFLGFCLHNCGQLAAIGVETDGFVVDVAGPHNFAIGADGWTPRFFFEVQRIPKLLDIFSENVGLRSQ